MDTERKKIMIVEDNPSNLKLFKLVLEPINCEIVEAYDGIQALEVAEESMPDIILMDIQIPRLDGLEVTKKLRQMEKFSNTPIIALTAFAMERDEKAGLEAGCNDYITKPFNTAKFLEVLRKYL